MTLDGPTLLGIAAVLGSVGVVLNIILTALSVRASGKNAVAIATTAALTEA